MALSIKSLTTLFLFLSSSTTGTVSLAEANKQLACANNLFSSGDIERAYSLYDHLYSLFPHSIALAQNCARAAYELNENQRALQLLEQALMRQLDNAALHYQYALSLLATGDYARGWIEYEWRWQQQDKQHINFPYALWRGEPVADKRLLLISEGDYGDTFQFIRFAQHLKKQGAHITLYTKKELIPLLQAQAYLDNVVCTLPSAEHIDYWQSLMSLPAYLRISEDTVVMQEPYIAIDAATVVRNKKYINPTTCNIGICWHADAANDANRPPLAQRSINQKLFNSLQLHGVTFYPLEKQQYDETFDVVYGSFVDTAALITQLDLIITVDTAIAHLAGALGRPTWVLLPYKSDWRWMLDRNDTPWYPTMTLFRNNKTTDWQELCNTVARELALFLDEKV